MEFNYMLLSRLKSDCDYWLGSGNRNNKYLWAGEPKAQIEKMLELYNGFSDEDKPEWITLQDINNYKKLMLK